VLRAERVEKITALVRWCACVGVPVAYHVIAMRSLRKGLISEADTCMHIPIKLVELIHRKAEVELALFEVARRAEPA
jgi:hypothetical protein